MENRKSIILIIVFLINFVFSNDVYSYGVETHRAITKEVIEFYNESNKREISDKEKEIIMLGSKEEDKPVYRTVNHFYDPIYNKGLLSKFLPAYDWAENTNAQAMYSPQYALLSKLLSLYSSDADYSFDRAVYEYVWGDKERGLKTLGHILHLIEDMSLPAHTRDDQHINGDYYETYARKYDINTINDISEELIENKEKQKQFSSLFDFFFSMANYSNNNFFSGDTIFDKKYVKPNINNLSIKEIRTEDGILRKFGFKKEMPILEVKRTFVFSKAGFREEYVLEDKNNFVTSNNWSLLSKQAVLHASGVVSLFFDKVNEEEDTMALFDKNRNSIKKLFGSTLYQSANVINVIQKNNEEQNSENLQTTPVKYISDFTGQTKLQEQNIIEQVGPRPIPPKADRLSIGTKSDNLQEQNNSVEEAQSSLIGTTEDNQQVKIQDNSNIQEPVPITPKYDPGFGGGGGWGGGGSTPSVQNTRPVITLTGSAVITITKNDTYTDAGATASDTEDGNITSNIVKTGNIDTNTAGTYTLRYNVTDSKGLTANEITRTIIVQNLTSPTITTPVTNPHKSATNTITFSGTASSTLLVSNDFSNATTTADGSENWSMTLNNFGQGTTTINFVASNTNYATSSVTEFSVFVDTQAPVFNSFSITECGYSISTVAGECLVPTTKVNPIWNFSDTNISFYEIYLNNVLATTTTATTTEITIPENSQNEIKVKAIDITENRTESSIKNVKTSISMPVIINEIAWSGTSATLIEDEWIELFNRSSVEIKLSDFTLLAQDGTPYIKLSGTILPNSFYLIERTDDTTINVVADLITPFSGSEGSGLGNSGEVLSLVYSTGTATTTIDKTPNLEDCGENWCAGTTSTEYRTMERKNPDTSGTLSTNWTSNNTYKKNGSNANNGLINGTPKYRNSANISQNGSGYLCSPYVHSFQEGLTYSPVSGTCTYIFPDFRTSATYGEIYKGQVGSSTLLMGHSLKNHITTITEKDQVESYMNDLNNNNNISDNIFVAIYETGGVNANINAFRDYFTTGSSTPPVGLNYDVLNWVYSE
ncbi:MAG: immunoglobulin-like domain-containing protein [Candidatus Paceibacterota bacterium]